MSSLAEAAPAADRPGDAALLRALTLGRPGLSGCDLKPLLARSVAFARLPDSLPSAGRGVGAPLQCLVLKRTRCPRFTSYAVVTVAAEMHLAGTCRGAILRYGTMVAALKTLPCWALRCLR